MMANITPLDFLKPGENAIIEGFEEESAEMGYLMELGLLVGTPVKLVKFAPLGDPIEIRLLGYHLSIRRSVAKTILVKKNR